MLQNRKFIFKFVTPLQITVTARNIESPFFTTYEDLQLVVTPTDVPIIFDDQM